MTRSADERQRRDTDERRTGLGSRSLDVPGPEGLYTWGDEALEHVELAT